MNKILIIDPGKGWGQFVSKMYCYQKLADHLNSKIIFLTKKSTQAEHYLKFTSFCDDVLKVQSCCILGWATLYFSFSNNAAVAISQYFLEKRNIGTINSEILTIVKLNFF